MLDNDEASIEDPKYTHRWSHCDYILKGSHTHTHTHKPVTKGYVTYYTEKCRRHLLDWWPSRSSNIAERNQITKGEWGQKEKSGWFKNSCCIIDRPCRKERKEW